MDATPLILRSRAKDRASLRFKSLKSATFGKRTAVRMLSFIEAHEQGYSQAAWTEVDGVHRLAGNPFVVVALFLDRKSQGVTSAFLVSLAFADVLFLVICVPYELINRFLFYWFGGRALCKVAGFTEPPVLLSSKSM